MKRNLFLTTAVGAMMLTACNKDDLGGTFLSNETISATLVDEAPQTRTALNGLQVVWNAEDKISVFAKNGESVSNNVGEIKTGVGTTSATFEVVLEGTDKVAAVYPYIKNTEYKDNKILMTLPESYPYAENGIGGAPMAALINNNTSVIAFKNAGALMGLTVNNIPAGYNKAILTSKGNEAITGACEITFDNEGKPTMRAATTATGKEITINFDAAQTATNKTFYFPIPVAEYSSLELSISNGSDTKTLKTRGLNAERSVRYKTTLTLDVVSGEIPVDVNGATKATEMLKGGKNSVNVTITESETNPTIILPASENSTSLSFESIPAEKIVTIEATTEGGGQVSDNVNISASSENNSSNSFNIDLPNSTVSLNANGETAVYNSVTATTAENTLILNKGVTVKKLIVKKGNIRVNKGAVLAEIGKPIDNPPAKVIIYKEEGAEIPSSLSDGFEVKDAAVADMQKAFAEGGTYTLEQDMDIVGVKMTVPEGKTVTLDLNGKTLKAANNANIRVNGTFTLQNTAGNGTIMAMQDYVGGLYDGGIICVDGENAMMTMLSGNINAVRANPTSKGQYGVTVLNGGDFTMSGGRIEAGWFAVSGNGKHKTQNSIINIEGGELISTADYAVYLPQSGTTTITGGTINGACGGIAINRGTLNISGETTKILSQDEGDTGDWSDGTGNLGNAALVVAAKYDDCTVNISGGTFSSEKSAAVLDRPASGHSASIKVTGGTFYKFDPAKYVAEGGAVTNFVEVGYSSVADGDYYRVCEGIMNEAALAAALAAGGEVALTNDIELTSAILVENEVTLNLNNHNITTGKPLYVKGVVSAAICAKENGKLTIKGTGTINSCSTDDYAVEVRGGELNIENGTFVGSITAAYALTGTINISGGEFSIGENVGEWGYDFVLNLLDDNGKNGTASINVTGGKFYKFDPANSNSENPVKNFVAAGYSSVADGDWYVVDEE